MLKKVPTPQDVIKYIDEVNSRIGNTTALVYSDFVEVREDNMREEGETEDDMRLFITGLDVKKFNKTPNLGDTFITVLYIGSIDDDEKIMVQPVVHEIADDGSVTIEIIQNAMVMLPRGERGQNGTSAGFGTPHASATALSPDSDPTVEVTASGGDYAKVFDFTFGIPVGAKILTYNETIKGVNELDTALLEISKFNHTPQLNELFACIFDAGEHGIFYQTRQITQTQTSAVIASVVSSNVIPAGSIDWAVVNGSPVPSYAGSNCITLGYGINAIDASYATVVGHYSNANTQSTAIGQYASAISRGSVAIGYGAHANGYSHSAIAIGNTVTAQGRNSTAIGVLASVTNTANNAIAIGHVIESGFEGDISIGHYVSQTVSSNDENADAATAIGYSIQAHNRRGSIIGFQMNAWNNCSHDYLIGGDINAMNTYNSIGLGSCIMFDGFSKDVIHATAIGYLINIKGSTNGIAIGSNITLNSNCAIAMGTQAYAYGENATAIGSGSRCQSEGIAIGKQASVGCPGGIAIGRYAIANAADITASSIAIGNGAQANYNFSTAIGHSAHTSTDNSIVLGDANLKTISAAVTTITKLSDERTKEDIELANTAQCLVDVNRLPVKRFKYKKFARFDPKDVHVTEFIAQDAQKVFPKSILTYDEEFPELDVNGEPILIDEVDDNGQIVYEDDGVTPRKVEKKFVLKDVLHMDTSFAIPTLWAAVQELTKRVQQLEYLLR